MNARVALARQHEPSSRWRLYRPSARKSGRWRRWPPLAHSDFTADRIKFFSFFLFFFLFLLFFNSPCGAVHHEKKEPPPQKKNKRKETEPKKRKRMVGWVYAFETPNIPGAVKIGATKHDPAERLRDANSSEWAQPDAYSIVWAVKSRNPLRVEARNPYAPRCASHLPEPRLLPPDDRRGAASGHGT